MELNDTAVINKGISDNVIDSLNLKLVYKHIPRRIIKDPVSRKKRTHTNRDT